jgi:hypothetical protein
VKGQWLTWDQIWRLIQDKEVLMGSHVNEDKLRVESPAIPDYMLKCSERNWGKDLMEELWHTKVREPIITEGWRLMQG